MPGPPGLGPGSPGGVPAALRHDGACAVKERNRQVDQAFSSVVNVLFSIMRGAVAAGEIDTERIQAAAPASLRRQLATWREENDGGGDLPDGALAACMITYAQLHGAITLELLGHVPPPLADRGALFDLEMMHACAALVHSPSPDDIAERAQGL